MLRKARIYLTILCAGIPILILLSMSAGYLLISEKNLYNNQFPSFQRDMNSIFSRMEQQTVFSQKLLKDLEQNGKYEIYLFDHSVPFLFNQKEHGGSSSPLQEILEYFNSSFQIESISEPSSWHIEFPFHNADFQKDYYVSVAELELQTGTIQVLVLFSLSSLKDQIIRQRILFLIIDLISSVLLFLFAFFFTARILKPVEKAQKEQAEFIAAASHELRTPLSVILSSVSALESTENKEQKHFLDIIKGEGKRMSRLIGDMLMLARSDNHSFNITKKPEPLDTLLLNCYEAFESLACEKEIKLSVRLPETGIPNCMCDGERIIQVIEILLDNALNYTPKGGFVHLSLNYEKSLFQISVADNGTGIPKEEKDKIFHRFYRIDTSRSQKDHFGLGLSIAYEIVKEHRGTIFVKDTLDGGSTFIISLPL